MTVAQSPKVRVAVVAAIASIDLVVDVGRRLRATQPLAERIARYDLTTPYAPRTANAVRRCAAPMPGKPMLDMLAEPVGCTGTPFVNANGYDSHTLST